MQSDNSSSLNEIVKQLGASLSDQSALDQYYDKLAAAGYAELQEYENPKFVVSEERLYTVTSGFPKLIRSTIPQGVSKVRYQLDIEQIKDYLVTNDTLWEL